MPAKKTSSSVYFIAGSDDAAVKKAASALAERLAPGADAFGLEVIDGGVETVDAAVSRLQETLQALATLPFLGGSKLVWLKSATFLADTVTGGSESVLAQLEKLCDFIDAGMSSGVTFLVSAVKPDKRRSAYKRLTKAGVTELHEKPDLGFRAGEEEVISWTAQHIRSRGLKISREAIEVLAARVGLDSGQLNNELDKLETAFGTGHPIEARDIREMVSATRESGIFDIGNAISGRDLPLALETLQQLLAQGEKGVGILLASIVPTVRNLHLAKNLLVRHKLHPPAEPQFFAGVLNKLPESETDYLPRKKDGGINTYGLGVAARSASHYALEDLQKAFHSCAEANWQLISGQGTDETILTRLLVGFMSR
jgi:DNA polymerase-3 subunit delta